MKGRALMVLGMCLVLVFAAEIPGVSAYVSENLEVVLTNQNPYPVEPGEVVDIEISLQNTGYSDAENIILEIEPESPFTLLQGQERTKMFSRIPAQDHVTASYKLHVDTNAISDNYELKFAYYQKAEMVKRTDKVEIYVQGKPKLILEGIETSPEQIEPGDSVTLTARIKNVGTGSASFMEASFVSNTTYILPVFSGGLYYMGEIKPGATEEAKFEMSVDNSAEYKTYLGVLTLNYKDDNGETRVTSFSVGIPVRGEPVIELLSSKVENSDLKVDLENIGTAKAKALKISLVQNGEVKDSAVASELKPTKHKTIRFRGFGYGEALINVSYLNERNEFFVKEFPVHVKPSARAEEGGGGVSPLTPVLVVVVVLESYYIWRLRKKRK